MPLFPRLGAFLSGRDEAGDHGNRNQRDYNSKTNGSRNLETDEDQNQRSTKFEVNESVHEIGQQEVHGTQAKNRADITTEYQERFLGDCEDCKHETQMKRIPPHSGVEPTHST